MLVLIQNKTSSIITLHPPKNEKNQKTNKFNPSEAELELLAVPLADSEVPNIPPMIDATSPPSASDEFVEVVDAFDAEAEELFSGSG